MIDIFSKEFLDFITKLGAGLPVGVSTGLITQYLKELSGRAISRIRKIRGKKENETISVNDVEMAKNDEEVIKILLEIKKELSNNPEVFNLLSSSTYGTAISAKTIKNINTGGKQLEISIGRDVNIGTLSGDIFNGDKHIHNYSNSVENPGQEIKQRVRSANQDIYIEDYKIFAEINQLQDGRRAVTRIDRFLIRALKNVDEFTFFVANTKTTKTIISLPNGYNNSGVSLICNEKDQNQNSDEDLYREYDKFSLKFPTLKEKSTIELFRRWDKEDVTPIPHIGIRIDECAGCKHGEVMLIFPKGELKNIRGKITGITPFYNINHPDGEPIPDYFFPSFSHDKMSATWVFAKDLKDGENRNRHHLLSWKWAN